MGLQDQIRERRNQTSSETNINKIRESKGLLPFDVEVTD